MAAVWTISVAGAAAVSPASLGVRVLGPTFRTQAASELQLERTEAFDATEQFAYGTAVELLRDGVKFFQGKVASNPRFGSADDESQTILVLDAWDEAERTVYQEVWQTGAGSVMLPRAILGLDDTGAAITTGQQVSAAVSYAASVGVGWQMGAVPAGFDLWPSEVNDQTVAEVIRTSMRFHPDWILWLDHSTSPPTLNVEAQSAATVRSYPVDGTGDRVKFDVRPVSERVPASVRLVYEATNQVDGSSSRTITIDKYPVAGADGGPGVLSATIPLAGLQATSQTQPIETRDLPTDQTTAKAWLKLKRAELADIDDAHFNVTVFSKRLVPEGTQPDPVNASLPRLAVADVTDLPRELVSGTVQDWMQVKVREVAVVFELAAAAGITAEEKAKLPVGKRIIQVRGTTATTKNYTGIASFTPAEDAPTGIAQSIYDSLVATQYEGAVTVTAEDVTADRLHGCAVNLTGGRSEWSSMKALVNQVAMDIENGTATLAFGPAKYLSPQDYLELQRSIRNRKPAWTSNRDNAQTGDDRQIVGSYDVPKNDETVVGSPPAPWAVTANGDNTMTVGPGSLVWFDPTAVSGGADIPKVFGQVFDFAGGSITIDVSEAIIYALAELTWEAFGAAAWFDSDFDGAGIAEASQTHLLQPTLDDMTLTIDGSAPADGFLKFPIARVTLTAGVAALDTQILTHNPWLQLSPARYFDEWYP